MVPNKMNRRNTRQKQLILDTLNSMRCHPTAEAIYAEVKQKNPKISLGTVYRNLTVLAEEGKIVNIDMSEASHFDHRTDNHNHFVCTKCKKVFDINIQYDSSLDGKEQKDGFYIENHETVFKGLCPDCLKKK